MNIEIASLVNEMATTSETVVWSKETDNHFTCVHEVLSYLHGNETLELWVKLFEFGVYRIHNISI